MLAIDGKRNCKTYINEKRVSDLTYNVDVKQTSSLRMASALPEQLEQAAALPVGTLVTVGESDHLRRLSRYFRDEGYEVIPACNGQDALRTVASRSVNMVIVQARHGGEDGLNTLRQLRRTDDGVGIIMTGDRRDEVDRIIGLELGADDYLVEPFSPRELLARMRSLSSRLQHERSGTPRGKDTRRVRFGGWILDKRARSLTNLNGIGLGLTKGEYALLLAFVDAPGRPLTREFLLQATHMHEDVFDRSVDVQVLRLRRKLQDDSSEPRIIRTERGIGYTFCTPVEILR